MKKQLFILALFLAPYWALAIAPEDYYNAGMDLFKNRDYGKAIQYFRAAVDERPDYWQAYQFLGEAYYQDANRTEAVVAMERSLKLHPDNPELRKFVSKIRRDSPWTSNSFGSGWMSFLALLLSVLSAAWTVYWTLRYKPFSNRPPSDFQGSR
ncbi:MAG TPA: tetratricopeptide repeat protein [bacterium]|nr:tetratricopeptide repeat protein [bacterium]